jgi:hypothetical protein
MEAAERAVTWGVGVQTAVSSLQRQRERALGETLEEKRNAEKCTKTVPSLDSRLPSTLYVYLACA